MRSLNENLNIIEQFMVRGCVAFYVPYYLDKENFIKQIHVTKKDIKATIQSTETASEDFDDGILDEDGLAESFVKNNVLRWILELEEKPTAEELRVFQYIADVILGQPHIMLHMSTQIEEQNYIDNDLIEIVDYNVYHGILGIIMALDKMGKIEKENQEVN